MISFVFQADDLAATEKLGAALTRALPIERVRRADMALLRDQVDYNDIRVYLGLEWKPAEGCPGLSGFIEVGYVFDRELVYLDQTEFDASDTIMLRGGIRY